MIFIIEPCNDDDGYSSMSSTAMMNRLSRAGRKQRGEEEERRKIQKQLRMTCTRKRSLSWQINKPKKHVQFASMTRIILVPHIKDFSQRQIKDCYVSNDEINTIRRECNIILQCSSKKQQLQEEGYVMRGLDKETFHYSKRRDGIYSQLLEAVFSMQQIHQTTGKDTTDMMSKLCQRITEPCVVAAQMAAISDIFSAFRGTWSQRHIPTIKSNPKTTSATLAIPQKEEASGKYGNDRNKLKTPTLNGISCNSTRRDSVLAANKKVLDMLNTPERRGNSNTTISNKGVREANQKILDMLNIPERRGNTINTNSKEDVRAANQKILDMLNIPGKRKDVADSTSSNRKYNQKQFTSFEIRNSTTSWIRVNPTGSLNY